MVGGRHFAAGRCAERAGKSCGGGEWGRREMGLVELNSPDSEPPFRAIRLYMEALDSAPVQGLPQNRVPLQGYFLYLGEENESPE